MWQVFGWLSLAAALGARSWAFTLSPSVPACLRLHHHKKTVEPVSLSSSITRPAAGTVAKFFILSGALFTGSRQVDAVGEDVLSAVDTGFDQLPRCDEVSVQVTESFLGLGLTEESYKGKYRVVVSSVKDEAPVIIKSNILPGYSLVAANGQMLEGLPLGQVFPTIKQLPLPWTLTFRDPLRLADLLLRSNVDSSSLKPISRGSSTFLRFPPLVSCVQPAQANKPAQCVCIVTIRDSSPISADEAQAKTGDVVEVLFQLRSDAQVQLSDDTLGLETGRYLDGAKDVDLLLPGKVSAKQLPPDSVYFILGSNKLNNKYSRFEDGNTNRVITTGCSLAELLPSWDLFLQGMRIGERRLIYLPLVFANTNDDSRGAAKANSGGVLSQVKSPIVVDVKMVSINGVFDDIGMSVS